MNALMTPEVLLTVLGVALLMLEAMGDIEARVVGRLALIGVAAITLFTFLVPDLNEKWWSGLYAWDPLAKFFKIFFLIVTALIIWMGFELEDQWPVGRGEFYILPLFTGAGLCLLASVNDFMVLFVALELVTISFYILVGYQRNQLASLEAAVKYLIMGALSSAFLVMGIAYVYGLTGSTQFQAVLQALLQGEPPKALYFGILLVMTGLLFKIAAVPFHLWAPDVYQGAPTPVTAFLSIGSKAAGFVLLIRVVLTGPFYATPVMEKLTPLLAALAGASILLGNLAAIPQTNLKRLLAYSGIGHAGYILAGLIVTESQQSLTAALVYLIAYLLASGLAFVAITVIGLRIPGEKIHSYAGLSQRSPLLAASLAIALVSLAGIPPLVGFVGKLGIFLALWEGGFKWLFIIGVISAVAGLYYYLGVVRSMYWSEPLDPDPIVVRPVTSILLGVLIFLVVFLGFWPKAIYQMVQTCVRVEVVLPKAP
jgi:NADH-quinone oxidoreductase subunit N